MCSYGPCAKSVPAEGPIRLRDEFTKSESCKVNISTVTAVPVTQTTREQRFLLLELNQFRSGSRLTCGYETFEIIATSGQVVLIMK